MAREWIVLEHMVFERGIEVDRVKVEVTKKLPPPTNVKRVKRFLGYTSFYRRFIKDFLKIAKPFSNLLAKDETFDLNENCVYIFC